MGPGVFGVLLFMKRHRSAWRVDFNISVSSFEGDIKGVRNFIDLALSTPYSDMPKIQFVSSIGVLRGMF